MPIPAAVGQYPLLVNYNQTFVLPLPYSTGVFYSKTASESETNHVHDE
jgi:hypothetical protein